MDGVPCRKRMDKAESLERRMEQLARGFMDVVSEFEAENARLPKAAWRAMGLAWAALGVDQRP